MISTDPWVWLSALLMLSIFSLLYGDNKFFRWAEATYTFSVVGHSTVTGVLAIQDRFHPLFTGAKPILIIPLVLGISSLFIVWRKYAWISTIAMSILLGVGVGISTRTLLATDVVGNMRAVIGEAAKIPQGPLPAQLGYLVRVVFTIVCLFYFVFTIMPKGSETAKTFGYLRRAGVYILLIYMGISLGNSMQQFVGTLAAALYQIVGVWLGLG